jgi:hypothetical protein
MNPVAVLYTDNYNSTVNWFISQYTVENGIRLDRLNFIRKYAVTENGQKYIFISSLEDILAFEFNSYIKSPFYQTLEDLVKLKIRKENEQHQTP